MVRALMECLEQDDSIHIGWDLRLWPSSAEKEFWSSFRLLKMLDFLGLCSSVLINVMLMRRLGIVGLSGWSWHHVPTIAYFTAGIVQLAVLLLAPAQHQRHRFAVNLANRLVKAVTVTWATSNMSRASVMQQFASVLNHSSAPYSVRMELLRFIATPCLIWVSHAVNFLLPFYILLPLQLYTLAVSSRVVRATACAMAAQQPAIRTAAAGACRRLRSSMHAAVMLLAVPAQLPHAVQSPGVTQNDDAEACGGVQGLLRVVAYTYAVVLLVLPCLVGFMVELTLKVNWLQGRQRPRRELAGSSSSSSSDSNTSASGSSGGRVPLLATSNSARFMVTYTSLVVAWFVCSAVAGSMTDAACVP